jgi:hypothetical protein
MALTDTNALATLAALKDDLGISTSAHDAALERRILHASALVEAYCGRRFRREQRTEKLPGYGTTRLLPSVTPIISVVYILSEDGSVVDSNSYSLEYDERGEAWAIYSESGWQWTAAGLQGSAAQPIPLVGSERRAFTVTYLGGYVLPNDSNQTPVPKLPALISEATLLLAATLWHKRGRDATVAAETVGDASVQFAVPSSPAEQLGIPADIAAMLSAYRRAV